MTLPIIEIPEEISSVCGLYQPVFSKPQFLHFKQFFLSLLITDGADIDALAAGFRSFQSYDALHHFVSEGTWDINDVLEQTVTVIKDLPSGQCFHEKGMLIIDDTLIEKYGKMIEGTGKLWDHSNSRYLTYAHCLVGLCWADHKNLRYPLRFELYRKEEDVTKELGRLKQEGKETNEVIPFKTKIQLAKELITWAIEQGIPFSTVVFDSWFFCKELVDFIEEQKKDWISMSKSNRNIVHQGKTTTCSEYGKTRNPEALPITKLGNTIYAINSVQMRFHSLERGKQTVRLVVSFQKKSEKEGGGWYEPVYLVSNRKDIRPERLLRAYQIRWNIETFFKDAKGIGLGKYQMRGLHGIKSHWCLVFTSAILLELIRLEVCTKEGKTPAEMSFGTLKARAFGKTMRLIIRQVLVDVRSGLSDEEIYAKLAL